MKTWAKLGLGCLVVLVAACIVSIALFFFAGRWVKNQVNRFTGGAAQMAENVKALSELDQKYPFTAPENGEVSEARLQAYIAVCAQVKPVMEPYAGWLKEHEAAKGKEKGGWQDVKKAMTLSAEITAAMSKALEAEHMGPAEFHWIQNAMKQAASEGGTSGGNGERQMLEGSIQVLESQLQNPGLSEADRQKLQGQLDQQKTQLEGLAAGGQVSPNRALYEKYADQLKANDLQQFGALPEVK